MSTPLFPEGITPPGKMFTLEDFLDALVVRERRALRVASIAELLKWRRRGYGHWLAATLRWDELWEAEWDHRTLLRPAVSMGSTTAPAELLRATLERQ
jgi:hypothetical protein